MDADDLTHDHDEDPDMVDAEHALAHLADLRQCVIRLHRRAQQRQAVRDSRLRARLRRAAKSDALLSQSVA